MSRLRSSWQEVGRQLDSRSIGGREKNTCFGAEEEEVVALCCFGSFKCRFGCARSESDLCKKRGAAVEKVRARAIGNNHTSNAIKK